MVSNGHVLEVMNRCYKHQKSMMRCSARWREWQSEDWDCGACAWNVYICAGSIVCQPQAREVLLSCQAPSIGAASHPPACASQWGALQRCLYKQGLHLRWNGERDCRTSAGIMV
mmetsp:Transcript_65708/g.176863  ORF Transcript_65708/g.176863 Transcript_65708/m.176863 type:complete len:114 (+) Transcript_65708:35-376(+)